MKDLTQGDELKTIIYFSLPILMGNIFQQIYNISDAIIIGNFLGKESLAAVGSSYQINVLIIAISIGISLGTSILISQCFGAKNIEKLKNAVNTGFIFSIILSFIITIFGFILSNRILILINVPENLLLNSNIYLKIIFIGVIPTFAYNSLTNILKGIGDSKTPTYILIVTVILNIILDIFFIAIMNYGISGAAIATVISQFISFILCFFYVRLKYSNLIFSKIYFSIDFNILKEILTIGMSAMLQQVLISIGFIVIQILVNSFGTDCIAAFISASRIDAFAELPSINLGQALIIFVAQNYGAKKMDRIIKGGKESLILGIIFSIITSIIIFIFPTFFISIFNKNPEIIFIGNQYLRTVSAFYIVFCLMQILNGLLLGYGKSFVPLIASITSFCMFQIPMAILLSKTSLRYNGIWIAAPIGWTGGMLIRLCYFLKISKKIKKGEINK
ncbi:MATE family efflux transporter [Fusobacterium simiae]|uniref:Multidrug-efflux transporter n=1 Tax=Fusobacterium simiae TaxID=855 RepID=A0ABT4DGC6_FUSSI|nr:MATE family efflux transporter [Fusobacterium simiae]MCY7007523.1 MATE family efflux transporter [Fusobacterium simiae]